MSLDLVLTAAGFAALVNAQATGTTAGVVSEIGVTATAFDPAGTITALPGELKRLATFGGTIVTPDTIHVLLRDDSADAYALMGFGLYLDDGTLLGVYSQPTAILQKSAVSTLMLAADIQFTSAVAGLVTFGDTDFINPPASTTVQGVIQIASNAEALAGANAGKAITPASLKAVIDALVNAAPGTLDTLKELADALGDDPNFAATMTAQLAAKADKVRTVTGGGLATGGGDLSANRVITVTKAAGADVAGGTDDTKAVTPKALKDYGRWSAGDIKMTARAAPETGWLVADGSAVSRTAYADLFAAVGTRYGAGDGSTTFNLPDYRGVFIRGLDSGRGFDPGRAQGSYQADDNKAHTHTLPNVMASGTTWDHGSGGAFMDPTPATVTGSSGSEARPKNVAELIVIKT